MSYVTRRIIPLVLFAISMLLMLSDYYFTIPQIKTAASEIQFDGTILAAFVLSLGAIGLVIRNIRQIRARAKGRWYFSIWELIMMFLFMSVGLALTQSSDLYNWLYTSLQDPVVSSMYAEMIFYNLWIVYASFKFRSVEASIIIIVGLIVMLRGMPIGPVIIPPVDSAGYWIVNFLDLPGERAMLFASAVAAVLLSIRMILGYERSFLAEGAE